MPSRTSKPKRPRDPNLLARSVVEDLIGETMEDKPLPPRAPEREENPAAVALSKLGASKGGKAQPISAETEIDSEEGGGNKMATHRKWLRQYRFHWQEARNEFFGSPALIVPVQSVGPLRGQFQRS